MKDIEQRLKALETPGSAPKVQTSKANSSVSKVIEENKVNYQNYQHGAEKVKQ